jgi:uncharacterized membrane protein YdjX (TVP38/TMEM64 family)
LAFYGEGYGIGRGADDAANEGRALNVNGNNHFRKVSMRKNIAWSVGLIVLLTGVGYIFREDIQALYLFLSDREKVRLFIMDHGRSAPLVFILIQVLQVLFAPIPGEATGFIGGYIFGAPWAFLYSSIGLTVGSCLNFFIGRILGVAVIRNFFSAKRLALYDRLFQKQGFVTLFLLFAFPGAPKDILSYLSGISLIPFKLFFFLACFGRMPGTLALSFQGEFLFKEKYGVFVLITLLFLVLAGFTIYFRERIYAWLDRME